MNIQTIRSLENNQIVKYRLGRAGTSAPIWGDWKTGKIFVQKRNSDYLPAKKQSRTSWQAGAVLIVTPQDENTAEFREEDFSFEFNTFCCENFYFEIDWSYKAG